MCSGVRQEQLASAPVFLFPSRGRRLGSLDFAFLVFSTAILRALCWARSSGRGAECALDPSVSRCDGEELTALICLLRVLHCSQHPRSGALLPAQGALVASGSWKAPRQGGREGGTVARGHLHHRIPVGSRDPVPGSLPGRGIPSRVAGRGMGQRGRRQQEQGTKHRAVCHPH